MSSNKISQVLNCIRYNPNIDFKTIVNKTDANKITIKKILFDLMSNNIVTSNNSYYSLDPTLCKCDTNKYNNDTYFNVYIKENHKQTIYYLFDYISKYWKSITSTLPTKTQMYKLITKINKKLNLELPIVWYKFGQIPPVVFNLDKDYSNYDNTLVQNIDEYKLRDIINKEQNYTSVQMRDNQYYSDDNGLYKVYQMKIKIERKIMDNNFNFVVNNIDVFFDKVPYFRDSNKIIQRFSDIAHNYVDLDKKYQRKAEFKTLYIKIFNIFWNIIAINNFKYNLWDYYINNNIKKDRIDNCDFDLAKLKDEFSYLEDEFYYIYMPIRFKEKLLEN